MGTGSQTADASGTAPRPWTMAAARDRISSTLFLAALLHGIIILGVTFGSGAIDFQPATSLDVVLVVDTSADALPPEDARVLAQSSLDGAGNTEQAERLRTAMAKPAVDAAPGPEQAGETAPRLAGDAERVPLVMTTAPSERKPADPELGDKQPLPAIEQTALPGVASAVEIIDEADSATVISDPDPRELVISARTRESRIATYLSNWKRKVERVGTLNFPRQAQARQTGAFPTLEVAISADGSLKDVIVTNSSGEQVLDQAAMDILRIAAPFDPFPDFLRADYDVLRFAYEWRFGPESRIQRMSAAQPH